MRTQCRSGLAVVAVVLLLSACGSVEYSGDDYFSTSPTRPAPSRTAAPAKTPVPATGIVRVGKGDTVYSLSRRHGVAVRDIIETNRLAPPYKLYVGQHIRLPAPQLHIVRRGETLYGISRRYGADTYAMARVNGLRKPYTIYVGQKLAVPRRPTATAATTRTAPVKKKTPPKTVAGTGTTKTVAKPPPPVPKPTARSGRGFRWPLRGKIISAYGPKKNGLQNDGINIAAARGSQVIAIENGVVAYAGNELRGFGNLLLIKHDGGWMSAYAHNDRLLVKRGQRVKRGQVISKVGSTGTATSPQLHFELRKGRRTVNPLKYLGSPNA